MSIFKNLSRLVAIAGLLVLTAACAGGYHGPQISGAYAGQHGAGTVRIGGVSPQAPIMQPPYGGPMGYANGPGPYYQQAPVYGGPQGNNSLHGSPPPVTNSRDVREWITRGRNSEANLCEGYQQIGGKCAEKHPAFTVQYRAGCKAGEVREVADPSNPRITRIQQCGKPIGKPR